MSGREAEHSSDAGRDGRSAIKPTNSTDSQHGSHGEAQAVPKASLATNFKAAWKKLGIDQRTYTLMFKGALAPTISLAAYQADAWADFYTTLGYLVIIMTILPTVIMPRAKFLQTMLINILFACFGAALALFSMYCAIRARIGSVGYRGPGTGGPGTSGTPAQGASTATYNSSGSAVAGVLLFVQIYLISVVRAKKPQYTISCILWAVFANVSMTYAPQFSTIAQAEAFTKKLLLGFLTGFSIAFGVSLLIFPFTSRHVVFKGFSGYIGAIREALQANLRYVHSLEDNDMFTTQRVNTAGEMQRSQEAADFKAKIKGLAGLHAKLSTDLPFAKREVAWGKLGPDDLQELFRLLRYIMLPTVGLSSLSDIFQRIAAEAEWDQKAHFEHATVDEAPSENEKARIEAVIEWHELMRLLREPFNQITGIIDQGLQHCLLVLQLESKARGSSKTDDEEASPKVDPEPVDKAFLAHFDRKSGEFLESKKIMLRGWCKIHDIDLPDDFFENPAAHDLHAPQWMQLDEEGLHSATHKRLRKQLFLCLYIEFLLINVSHQVHNLIAAVDTLQSHGKLCKKRLIVPGLKRLRKWIISLVTNLDDSHTEEDLHADGGPVVFLGDAYHKQRDPEHLPPANAWERFGNQLRKIAHFFKSPASSFGFRVACATMSIAILNYLEISQTFFTTQRLFWSQIMISISMSPTAGQSLRNFILRILGTAMALVLSWIAWYIVDGETAGIIVFYFIFLHGYIWVLLKYPQYMPIGMIGQITMGLILGYELQVRKVGIAVATSNGQAYWPVYILGPIRLATVAAGLFVAWMWTIIPYPISEHNQVRRGLGSSLYLLANYYSVMHETVRLRLRNQLGDTQKRESPARKLEKARQKLYAKANLAISGLSQSTGFLKYDIPIGGRFPQKQYQNLVTHLQSILNYMSLVSLASLSFNELRAAGDKDHGLKWLAEFEKLATHANMTSEHITTILSLLSNAVNSGSPLPPYLRVPEPSLLADNLDSLGRDLLSIRHIAEPGYASFSVIHMGTKFIHDDLKAIVAGIKELVGELDFSYHIVSTTDPTRNNSDETLVYARTNTSKDELNKQD